MQDHRREPASSMEEKLTCCHQNQPCADLAVFKPGCLSINNYVEIKKNPKNRYREAPHQKGFVSRLEKVSKEGGLNWSLLHPTIAARQCHSLSSVTPFHLFSFSEMGNLWAADRSEVPILPSLMQCVLMVDIFTPHKSLSMSQLCLCCAQDLQHESYEGQLGRLCLDKKRLLGDLLTLYNSLKHGASWGLYS